MYRDLICVKVLYIESSTAKFTQCLTIYTCWQYAADFYFIYTMATLHVHVLWDRPARQVGKRSFCSANMRMRTITCKDRVGAPTLTTCTCARTCICTQAIELE